MIFSINRIKKIKTILLAFLIICESFAISLAADENQEPTTFVFPTYYHTYGIRKAGAFELFLFMGLKVSFSNPEGLACVRLDSWEDPDDPHDDDEVTVYGVNSGQNNIIYNKSMSGLEVYGIDEEDNQLLNQPHGICANSRGDVYVADTGNNRIVRLFNPGHKLEYVTSINGQKSPSGKFNSPQQVALDNSGNIYISDTGNNLVQVYDKNNNFKLIFPDENNLLNPTVIAVTDLKQKHQSKKENFVIVVDSSKHRINKFTLKGKLLKQVLMSDLGFTNATLEYGCLDYFNQLLITDSHYHCIHKFDNNLNYIISFGSEGDDDHQFIEPKGIAIYRRYGQLFIAEKTGAQYYWIGTDITDLSVTEVNKYVFFEIVITEPSYINADIFDKNDQFVKRIVNKYYLSYPGRHKIHWDKKMGKRDSEFYKENEYIQSKLCDPYKKLPKGEYRIRITAEPSYSSRTYFERIEEKNFTINN